MTQLASLARKILQEKGIRVVTSLEELIDVESLNTTGEPTFLMAGVPEMNMKIWVGDDIDNPDRYETTNVLPGVVLFAKYGHAAALACTINDALESGPSSHRAHAVSHQSNEQICKKAALNINSLEQGSSGVYISHVALKELSKGRKRFTITSPVTESFFQRQSGASRG